MTVLWWVRYLDSVIRAFLDVLAWLCSIVADPWGEGPRVVWDGEVRP